MSIFGHFSEMPQVAVQNVLWTETLSPFTVLTKDLKKKTKTKQNKTKKTKKQTQTPIFFAYK